MKTLVAGALLLASCAPAAAACSDRADLVVRLYEDMDMRLVSWGLNRSGNMEELFMNDAGIWAVVRTDPTRCSTIISIPTHHFEGLVAPNVDNNMNRRHAPLVRGQEM